MGSNMQYNCTNAGLYEELSIISSYQQKAELTTEDKSTSGMAMILGFCFNLLCLLFCYCCFIITIRTHLFKAGQMRHWMMIEDRSCTNLIWAYFVWTAICRLVV